MTIGSEDKAGQRMGLSALADGELDAEAAAMACAHWRVDPEARESWHAYHLIGDVMRSDELAAVASRDRQFLQQLRERLADEPAVLAPAATQRVSRAALTHASADMKVRRSAWAWTGPAAVAAGFMALASVLVLNGAAVPWGGRVDSLAQAVGSDTSRPKQAAEASSLAAIAPGDPQTLVADGKLIRDARLERYFAAHTQFGGTSALGVPSGFLRAATTQPPGR
jgi:sigma-E factor negative regulatory protein RseA